VRGAEVGARPLDLGVGALEGDPSAETILSRFSPGWRGVDDPAVLSRDLSRETSLEEIKRGT